MFVGFAHRPGDRLVWFKTESAPSISAAGCPFEGGDIVVAPAKILDVMLIEIGVRRIGSPRQAQIHSYSFRSCKHYRPEARQNSAEAYRIDSVLDIDELGWRISGGRISVGHECKRARTGAGKREWKVLA